MERDLIERINGNEAHIYKKDQENLVLKTELDTFHTQQQAAYAFAATLDFSDTNAAAHFSPPASAAQVQSAQLQSTVSHAPSFDSTAAWNNSLYNSSLWGPSPLAPAFTPQTAAVVPHAHPHHPHHLATKSRGRSSSMLSDVSGFTQSSATDDEMDGNGGGGGCGGVGSSSVPNHNSSGNKAGAVGFRAPPPGFEFSPMMIRRSNSGGNGNGNGGEMASDGSSSASGSDGSLKSARETMSPSPT